MKKMKKMEKMEKMEKMKKIKMKIYSDKIYPVIKLI